MAKAKKNITDTTIITAACRERFLPTKSTWSKALDDRGILLAGLSQLGAGFSLGRRDKSYHSIMFCLDGDAVLTLPESTHALERGDCWIVPAHMPFRYSVDQYWDIAWFHISENDPFKYVLERDMRFLIDVEFNDLVLVMDRYAVESSATTRDARTVAYALGVLVGCYLDRLMFENAGSQQNVGIARRIAALWLQVKRDLAFRWTTENLASRVGLSPGYFRSLVKSSTGVSPMETVTGLRMEQAKTLLLHSDHKLAAIALLVGYDSPYSLSRAFKRVTGMWPRDFRKAVD